MKRARILEHVKDCEDFYGALITNSVVTRRDIMRCVRAGLVKSVGQRQVYDADENPVEPERWREGFVLTEKGRRLV
jgi:hypothetical protein